jgi:hypothetical protein
LALILLGYLALAVGYGLVNPLFEAPDEHFHFFTARYIARERALPALAPGEDYDPLLSQEAAQPPLYYALSALLIAEINTDDAPEEIWLNPRVQLGDASAPTNTNQFVHTNAEGWPWHGYVLAAHVLRLFSAFLGLGTLLCLYGSARLIWPNRPGPALLATALVAFLPQFNFHHGAITNDVLIIFLASATIFQLLRLWHGALSRRRLLLLGATIGLAILTKAAGILLLAHACGVLLILAWRKGEVRQGLRAALLVAGAALLMSGWLLWRNWSLYGDFTAANQFVRVAGGEQPIGLGEALGQLWAVRASFFAIFGWFNVRGPDWMYAVWEMLVLAALVGLGWTAWRDRALLADSGARWRAVWLAGWPLLVLAGMILFMMRTPAAQGRLLFPALIPLAVGLAHGLWQWPRPLPALAPALALVTSLYGLLGVIPAAYEPPPLIAPSDIPATAIRLDTPLGHNLTLLAAEIETAEAHPGDWAWLTLYWQATGPVPQATEANAAGSDGDPRAPELVVLLLGRDMAVVGKLQTYHGGGLLPASLWPAGPVLADRFAVRLAPEMAVPTGVIANVRLATETIDVSLPAFKVTPTRWPSLSADVAARLGDHISLAEADLATLNTDRDTTVTVTARWQVSGPVASDYTTFVHLGDPSLPPLATGDSPPLKGSYPTRFWPSGEVITGDVYQLHIPADLPPGRYPISLGMYDPATLTRLPLAISGERQPGDAYQVGVVVVRQ